MAAATRVQRSVAALAATTMLLAGCGLGESEVAVVAERSDRSVTTTVPEPVATEPVVTEPVVTEPPADRQDTIDQDPVEEDAPPSTELDVDEVLAELDAAGFCDPVDVEDEGLVTAMHFVVGGELQVPCYSEPPGEEDARLLDNIQPRV